MIAPCPHRPPCPGCPRYGEPGLGDEVRQQLEALAADAGVEPAPTAVGEPTGFRHRARLAVRGRARSPRIGIFERGSHRVVDIPKCRIHHPQINEVARAVRRAVVTTRTEPYREGPHRGDLRYLQVVVEPETARAQVVLIGNGSSPRALAPLARSVAAELGSALHSLWWNGQPARSNAIVGPHWRRLAGPEAVCHRVAGVRVFHPPGAFGQSHPELVQRIAARVMAWTPPGAVVAELYAGCGAFGLGLLARGDRVWFNERGEHALRGLALGLADRPAPEREQSRIVPGDAALAGELLKGADVVLVDPPRRGLDAALAEALERQPPERLLYLSCGLPSLARDTAVLCRQGRLRLVALEPFALFPYTEHVEILAVFERRPPAARAQN